jgi:hypothetical protein
MVGWIVDFGFELGAQRPRNLFVAFHQSGQEGRRARIVVGGERCVALGVKSRDHLFVKGGPLRQNAPGRPADPGAAEPRAALTGLEQLPRASPYDPLQGFM